MRQQKPTRNTLYLIVTVTLVRMLLAAVTGLGTGESYYFRGARELALSYFDQPPFFFWLSGATIRLFGENSFALRLPAVLLFAGSSWLMFLITRHFYNARSGFYAVVLFNLSAVFSISIGLWFQPDGPLIFFWLCCVFCVLKAIFPPAGIDIKPWRKSTKAWRWWMLAGITMGFTTLSKYHVLFLAAGVVLFCLLTPRHRHWLWHPAPYIALVINFIFALPILIWNYQHDWVSFLFQGGRAASGEDFSLHFDWFFRSIGGQALWLLPWIWVPLVVQLFKTYREGKEGNEFSWFCFWTAILPIVFFTLVTLWSDLQFHFHWQAPGYMMLFMPLGYAVDKSLHIDKIRYKLTNRWLKVSVVFTVLSVSVLAAHMVTGFWSSYGPKWVAVQFGNKTDPTIDGNDYDELRERFEEEGWLNKEEHFVATARWWLTGKVDWALRGELPAICISEDPRNYAFYTEARNLLGHDAIIVGRNHERSIDHDVRPFFDKVTEVEPVYIKRSGVKELKLKIYYCEDFKIPDQTMEHIPVYRQLIGKKPFNTRRASE